MARNLVISILAICIMISSEVAARPKKRCWFSYRVYFSYSFHYGAVQKPGQCQAKPDAATLAASGDSGRRRMRRSVDATCSLAMKEAGLNTTTLLQSVAHGIHSITVEDIKYYFDPSVPNENDIPTVNANLSGQHVLMSAPFGAEFNTPGMRMMDFVLSNDEGNDNFMVQGITRMEKIAHGMHMLELWHKTSEVYEEIKANPPNDKVCSCAIDEDANGILDALKEVSIFLRRFGKMEEIKSNQMEEDTSNNEVDGDAGNASENNSDDVPELKNAESWKVWKEMLNYSMLNNDEIHHLATYLYCKIATFA